MLLKKATKSSKYFLHWNFKTHGILLSHCNPTQRARGQPKGTWLILLVSSVVTFQVLIIVGLCCLSEVVWDASDASGTKISSGIYFYKINAKGVNGSDFLKIRKMLLIK